MARIKFKEHGTSQWISISECLEPFILSRKIKCSNDTIDFYRRKLRVILQWFEDNDVKNCLELSPQILREFLDDLSEKGHNGGGVHTFYRPLKAYLRWIWDEYDIPIKNPIDKVKMEQPLSEPIPGIPIDAVAQMLDACGKYSEFPDRDKAIIAVLSDTGVRRSELLRMNIGDLDLSIGKITLHKTKGGKFNNVFCGRECRKLLRKYLACLEKTKPKDPLWLDENGERLSERACRSMLTRRQHNAGLTGKEYAFHAFRRCFALECKRNGDDIGTISRKLTHSTVEVTKRYLALDDNDDQEAAVRSSPLDNRRRK